MERMDEANNVSQAELEKLSPRTQYVFLGVGKGLMELSLEARQIAGQNGSKAGCPPWGRGEPIMPEHAGESDARWEVVL